MPIEAFRDVTDIYNCRVALKSIPIQTLYFNVTNPIFKVFKIGLSKYLVIDNMSLFDND